MHYTKFIDRENELKYLEKVLASSDFQMIPVWGRRRIGKTALLLKALEGSGVYFLATETSKLDNIRRFKEDASRQLDDPMFDSLADDWAALFRYLGTKDLPIVLDEFPYLVASDPGMPSVLQRIIDLHLANTGTKLFLCGSSIRMMEDHVMHYRAPLYGRRTGQLNLGPLHFRHLKEFFPDYSFEDLVRTYGVCGGIPMYLLQFDPEKSFWENIEEKLLDTHSILYSEADFLVKEEFTQVSTYKSILRAIASGRTKMDGIRNDLSAGRSDISSYLANLISVGFVDRCVPATENPARSRRGLYVVKDNYLRFYFRYLFPNKTIIETGNAKGVLDLIRKDHDAYIGRVFEDVARQAFLVWSNSEGLTWDRAGSWWHGEEEIDIVATSTQRNEILVCEVKWSDKPMARNVMFSLIEKTEKIRWKDSERKTKYLFISRSGFLPECEQLAEEKDMILWSKDDVCKILWP